MTTTKLKIRIKPSKSVTQTNPAGKRKQMWIIVGLVAAGAAVAAGIYFLTRNASAAPARSNGAGSTAGAAESLVLLVNGDRGLTTVNPGISIPIAVSGGKPGDPVAVNYQMVSATSAGPVNTFPNGVGVFDSNGNFGFMTVLGLNPNGPVMSPRLPLLTTSLPGNMMTTYNIQAADTTTSAQSNIVQATVSITQPN